MRFLQILLLAVCGVLLCACETSPTGSYQSDVNYYEQLPLSPVTAAAMRYEGPLRNPVIVIHGFLGARLRNAGDGREIWGTFSRDSFRNEYLRDLALPMAIGRPLSLLRGDTRAEALLDVMKVDAFGVEFVVQGYGRLLKLLEDAGYVPSQRPLPKDKHFYSMFVFYYDWRRDLAENARDFARFVEAKKAYMKNSYSRVYGPRDYDVKFDVVAHSMGGMLARYYLKYGDNQPGTDGSLPVQNWAGAQNIDRLVQVGTPNGGYFDTFLELTRGLQLEKGIPAYPVGVLGTFHTYYQMLPNPVFPVLFADRRGGEALDVFDYDTWVRFGWGLASPKADATLKMLLPNVKTAAERRKIALDHLKKCLTRGKLIARSLAVPDNFPPTVTTQEFIFLGDSIPTSVGAVIDTKNGMVKEVLYEPGDGKISTRSTRFDLRDSAKTVPPVLESPLRFSALFHLKGAHMGITSSAEFASNVRFLLLQTRNPRRTRE